MYAMQARAKAVEAQLVSATTELQELKERHQKLEARHLLLEKVSQINKQTDKGSELPATVSTFSKACLENDITVEQWVECQARLLTLCCLGR